MTSLVLILGTFALVLPYQEAAADHSLAQARIEVTKNASPSGHPLFISGIVLCSSTGPCILEIDIPKRYEALFKRDCGSTSFTVFIAAGTTGISTFCPNANGPWGVNVLGFISNPHPAGIVEITVIVL